MSEIPADIEEAANKIAMRHGLFFQTEHSIAKAILAEREAQRERFERLVKIVPVVGQKMDSDLLDAWADGVACAKREITAAIRAEEI